VTDDFIRGPFEKLRAREFDDPDVRKVLAAMAIPALIVELGHPAIVTRYAEPRGHWRQGDDRPALADDDPAVMQAIGRCATAELQRMGGFAKVLSSTHDTRSCAWCDYPIAERLAACDWAVFRSRYVEAEFAVWYADQDRRSGATHQRTTRQDVYENPTWAEFWALPAADRQARIRAAQYPMEAAA